MLRRIQKMMSALLIAALLAVTVFPTMALASNAKVNSSSARVYKSASTSSASVKMKKGTKLTVKSVSGQWAKVSLNGHTGYMPVKYLNSTSRYKAYTRKSTYIYKSASSSSSKKAVSANTALYVVGKSGSYYRVQNASGSCTGYVKAGAITKAKSGAKKTSGKSAKAKVVKMDWFKGGSSVLKKGKYATIYDVKTGIKVKIKRMGGHNHADVEPATAADTRKLLKISGGKWSWDSHAEILISSGKYVACAINTMPHGDQTILNNNYDGQFCLHMSGSLTHGSGKQNAAHQNAIQKAYNWAH